MPLADTPPQPPMSAAAPVEIRITAERVAVDQGAHMGLVGLHYLRPIGQNWLGGVSVFGAAQGDRGGFFGWGVNAAYRQRWGDWSGEAGLFVGGGGGSPGWVGGGLMLRPQIALARHWGDLSLGLGVSQVRFPSGAVHGTQPFLSLGTSSDVLFGPAAGRSAAAPLPEREQLQALAGEVSVLAGRYAMRAGSPRRDGTGAATDLRFGGLVLRRAWAPGSASIQPYWAISAAGSLTSAYAGYAELIGSLGMQYSPIPALALRAEAGLGSGGAGSLIDSGGGLLRKASVGASLNLGSSLSVAASLGRVASQGRFQANEARLELGLRGFDLVPRGTAPAGTLPLGEYGWAPWTLSSVYAHYARMTRDAGGRPALGLTALKVERELDAHWRVIGQAGIGVDGNAGGYATGQLGLGWLTAASADPAWRFGAEASLGAAGGGGVNVGGGLIGQAQLQARTALSPEWSLQADAGWLRSRNGALSSPFVGISAVYSFSRLQIGR